MPVHLCIAWYSAWCLANCCRTLQSDGWFVRPCRARQDGIVGKSQGSRAKPTPVHVFAFPITNCMTLGELLNIPKAQFLHL